MLADDPNAEFAGMDLKAAIAKLKEARAAKDAAKKKAEELAKAQADAKKKLLEAKKKVTKAFTEKPKPKKGQLSLDDKIKLAYSKFSKARAKWAKDKGDAALTRNKNHLYSVYMFRKKQKDKIAKKAMESDPEFAKAQ